MAVFHYDDAGSTYDDADRMYDEIPFTGGGATFNLVGGMSASALSIISAAAHASGVMTAVGSAPVVVLGSGSMSAVMEAVASGYTVVIVGSIDTIDLVGGMTASALNVALGSGHMESELVAAASALNIVQGAAPLSGVMEATATGDVIKVVNNITASLVGGMSASGTVIVMGAAAASLVGEAAIDGLVIVIGDLNASGVGSMDASGYRLGEIITTEWPSEANKDNRTRLDWVVPDDNTKKLRLVAPPGTVLRFVAPQLEEHPYVRPFVRTSGEGGTRGAGRAQLDVLAKFFNGRRGAIFFRYRTRQDSRYLSEGTATLWSWIVDEDNLFEIKYDFADQGFVFRRRVGGTDAISTVSRVILDGDDLVVGAVWTDTGVQIIVENEKGDLDAGDGYSDTLPLASDIGSGGSTSHIDSDIMKMVAVRGVVSAADSKKIRSLIRTPQINPNKYPSDCVLVVDFAKRISLGG